VDSLGRTQGKVVSYHQVITTAATLDDGDRFLSHDELSWAMASIAPSQLPPQVGELAAPTVMSALRAAWQLVATCIGGNAARWLALENSQPTKMGWAKHRPSTIGCADAPKARTSMSNGSMRR
jgi:hypothetical protein